MKLIDVRSALSREKLEGIRQLVYPKELLVRYLAKLEELAIAVKEMRVDGEQRRCKLGETEVTPRLQIDENLIVFRDVTEAH